MYKQAGASGGDAAHGGGGEGGDPGAGGGAPKESDVIDAEFEDKT